MAGDTFLFADIVGFTSFTERYGDDAAADPEVVAAAHALRRIEGVAA